MNAVPNLHRIVVEEPQARKGKATDCEFDEMATAWLTGSCLPNYSLKHPVRTLPFLRVGRQNVRQVCLRQVACMRHFQTEPLSALAAAAGNPGAAGIRAAAAALPDTLRGCARSGCASSSGSAPDLAGEVQGTLRAWSGWAVALRWVNAAARAVGVGHPAGV